MKKKPKEKFDSIVIFERPVKVDKTVYGLLYRKEDRDKNEKLFMNRIATYTTYILGASRWVNENNNTISPDSRIWIDTKTGEEHSIHSLFFKDYCLDTIRDNGFDIAFAELGKSIKYNSGDIDADVCIVNESLIGDNMVGDLFVMQKVTIELKDKEI